MFMAGPARYLKPDHSHLWPDSSEAIGSVVSCSSAVAGKLHVAAERNEADAHWCLRE
jgi:hypothetical protein